jgi:hypothetical protein
MYRLSGLHRLAGFLAKLAIVSVALAVSMTYFDFPPMDYAGMVFFSSVAVVLGIGAGALALMLVTIILVKGTPPKPLVPMIVSGTAIAVAFGYIWAM